MPTSEFHLFPKLLATAAAEIFQFELPQNPRQLWVAGWLLWCMVAGAALLSWALLTSKAAIGAPVFAIALIPVLGLTGSAVDYSRANSIRSGGRRDGLEPGAERALAAKRRCQRCSNLGFQGLILADILDQRDRDYCIAVLRSRWSIVGDDVRGAGGRWSNDECGRIVL